MSEPTACRMCDGKGWDWWFDMKLNRWRSLWCLDCHGRGTVSPASSMPRGFHATGALVFTALTAFFVWLGIASDVASWGIVLASLMPFTLACAFAFCWLRVGRGTTGGTDDQE